MKHFVLAICIGILLLSGTHVALAQNTTTSVIPTLLPGPSQDADLAQKIRSGEIHLTDIPRFISYFINFGVTIAGSISILFLVIGGYRYIVGGVIQSQREQGKQTIMYALIGLILSILSWAIVNTIQLLVT